MTEDENVFRNWQLPETLPGNELNWLSASSAGSIRCSLRRCGSVPAGQNSPVDYRVFLLHDAVYVAKTSQKV